MSCLGPLTAYYSKDVNPSGKRSLVFKKEDSFSGVPVMVACQRCVNCRIQRAAAGAIRCVHESKSHPINSFVTLTYSDANLPADGGLHHEDFQLFMKRTRDWWSRNCGNYDPRFKMVMCGEYGETTARPHYHALLFGCDFSDRRFFSKTKAGGRLDTSQILTDLWGLGHCTVGDVEYESARYVCGYVLKKQTGPKAADYYMGRRPDYIVWGNGIGADYFAKFGPANYSQDFVVIGGKRMRIPRYYDTKFELIDPVKFASVKRSRRAKAASKADDLSNRRSWTREKVANARLAQFRRDVDGT
jgi:hypothetical protein